MSSHGRRVVAALAITFLFLSVLPSADAQISTASINGTVRDVSGAVIVDAELVLGNVGTGIEAATRTNSVGLYRFANLQPGPYTLSASNPGFQTRIVEPFTLVVNQIATFDFSMAVGAVAESIIVEATGVALQASSSELGAAVTERQVVDLPLNGRNFTQLLALTPGVAPVSVAQNAGGFSARPIGQFQFPSVNGQNNRSNLFLLDGVINFSDFVSTYAVPPIIDTVQEFKVNSHHDDAEFGGAVGGIVNVVTKGGTNEYHGAGWWFLRNDNLDARNFFRPTVTEQKRNQFGGSLGGAIIRNKTFFMIGYEGFRLRTPADRLYRVPTAANLQGDLSDIPEQIFNPFTTMEDPSNPGTFTRQPFSNNQIPQSMIDPGMAAYAQATLPAPIVTGVADRNGRDLTPFRQNQEGYTARVDHMFTNSDSAWFRWSGTLQDNEGSGGRQTLSSLTEYRAINIAGSWVHTFNPTTVLQLQVARSRTEDNSINRFRDRGFLSSLGCSPTYCGSFASGEDLIPNYNVIGFFGGGESNTLNVPTSGITQFKGSATKVIGNHTLKFGGEGNNWSFESFYENLNSAFRVQTTNNPRNPSGTGSSLASYLLGLNDSAGRRNVNETLRPGGEMGFYIHDSWKVTPKLTVNLGLRYDRTFIPPYGKEETIGKQGGIETGNLDMLTGIYFLQVLSPSCAERGRAPCIPTPDGSLPENVALEPRGKIFTDTKKNFQPRLGIAYRPSDKTVVRTGFGVFFDNWAGISQMAQAYQGAWPDVGQGLANNVNVPSTANPTPTINGANPFPEGLIPAPTPFNFVSWFTDPRFENAYSMQWNFGFQHQINPTTLVDVNYVGSGGRRLTVGGYWNTALEPGPGDIRPRTPFPHAQQSFFDKSWGRSNYHGFQFQLSKRFSNNLAYQVSYTWSKSIDIGSSGWYGVEGFAVQDVYDIGASRGLSGFDLPHVLAFNWVYELPIGSGRAWDTGNKVLNYIVGGWQFNGIANFRSGIPYTPVVSGDLANVGNTGNYLRPDYVGDPVISSPSPSRWINTSAFALPPDVPGAPGIKQYGNAGRHTLRNDGGQNFDLSLFRKFPFGEGKRIELRTEWFNAFNHPTFGTPGRVMNNPNFGVVTGTALPERNIQFGLKIIF